METVYQITCSNFRLLEVVESRAIYLSWSSPAHSDDLASFYGISGGGGWERVVVAVVVVVQVQVQVVLVDLGRG